MDNTAAGCLDPNSAYWDDSCYDATGGGLPPESVPVTGTYNPPPLTEPPIVLPGGTVTPSQDPGSGPATPTSVSTPPKSPPAKPKPKQPPKKQSAKSKSCAGAVQQYRNLPRQYSDVFRFLLDHGATWDQINAASGVELLWLKDGSVVLVLPGRGILIAPSAVPKTLQSRWTALVTRMEKVTAELERLRCEFPNGPPAPWGPSDLPAP